MIKRIRKLFQPQSGIVAGLILVVVGAVIGGSLLFYNWQTQYVDAQQAAAALKNNPAPTIRTPAISGVPIRVQVPSVSVDASVIPGYYFPANQSWTLTSNKAQWGVMTAEANNKQGVTFIYAHDLKNLFAPLSGVNPGDTASVLTANGHTFTYSLRTTITVTPDNTNLFSYQGKPILVLQTCSGVWYQNRQLFIFDLVKAA